MGTAILGITIAVIGLMLFWVDQRKISPFWRRFVYPGIILFLLTGITMMVHGVNDASFMRTPGGEILRDFLQAGSDRVLPGDYDLTGSIKGYTPNPVYVGDAVTFTYVIRNDGKDKVPKLSYMEKFYVDDKCVSSNGLTMALRSGAGYMCRMGKGYHNFIAKRAGVHTYKLEITTRGGLVDANPENNVITGRFIVRDPDKYEDEKALIDSASDGDVAEAKLLLKKGVDAGAMDNSGMTALMKASFKGHIDIVKLLLAAGADVNTQQECGFTALTWAVGGGHIDIVELLLEAGVDVNVTAAPDEEICQTALTMAARAGHTNIVKLLLEAGADVNGKDTIGKTALMYSAEGGHRDIVELLLENKAEVNYDAKYIGTALMCAVIGGHIDTVEMLLKAGADVNAQGDYGWTALKWARKKGNKEIIKLLKESGAQD